MWTVSHIKTQSWYTLALLCCLINVFFFFYCYDAILCKRVFICFIWIECFHKSNHPRNYFDGSCIAVTNFSPLERYESSSNICKLLILLITVIHLFKARLRQPGVLTSVRWLGLSKIWEWWAGRFSVSLLSPELCRLHPQFSGLKAEAHWKGSCSRLENFNFR